MKFLRKENSKYLNDYIRKRANSSTYQKYYVNADNPMERGVALKDVATSNSHLVENGLLPFIQ